MIEFEDKKYGKVIIIEPLDIKGIADYPSGDIDEIEDWVFEVVHRRIQEHASVIGFRDIKRGINIILKNRTGPLEDYKTEQFILNYGVFKVKEEEIYEPINSRFEILDL